MTSIVQVYVVILSGNSIVRKFSHPLKNLLVTHHSKIYRLHHGGQSFIFIYTKGDGNCQALQDINANNFPEEEELVVLFTYPCLTSIYQPPLVAVNGLLKKMTREEYYICVDKLLSILKQSANIKKLETNFSILRRSFGVLKNANGKIDSVNRKIVGVDNMWICNSVLLLKYHDMHFWSDFRVTSFLYSVLLFFYFEKISLVTVRYRLIIIYMYGKLHCLTHFSNNCNSESILSQEKFNICT